MSERLVEPGRRAAALVTSGLGRESGWGISEPAALRPLPASVEPPGWYGKLSMLGDFAQRRLPAEFIRACDSWLARALTASRSQLGEGWLHAYLNAPILSFACAPGLLGPDWWVGVLMPSCDKVGRYYPLLIAERRAEPPLQPQDLISLQGWFEHLAQAAIGTLGEKASVDKLEHMLSRTPPTRPATLKLRGTVRPAHSRGELDCVVAAPSFVAAMQSLGAAELASRLQGCSVWWRRDGDIASGAMSVVRGLPTSGAFTHLLLGS